MRLLLDTSYFFSYFKVAIEGFSFDFINILFNRNDLSLCISEMSYVELTAKCFKLGLVDSKIQTEDIISGLDSLRNDSRIESIGWYHNPKIIEIANVLRKIHTDFFDCMIFGTAVLEADAIGTFDDTLYKKIVKNNEIKQTLRKINPEFEFWFYDFKNIPKRLK